MFTLAIVLMLAFVTGVQASPKTGDIIPFGEWDWRVLDVHDGKALIITENVIEERPYIVDGTEVTWETCALREYLNGEFLQKFTTSERERIEETRILNPDNLWYGTNGGNATIDKVFLLSLEEVSRYFDDSGDYQNKNSMEWYDGFGFSNTNDSKRIASSDKYASWWWWLRSPGSYGTNAAVVNDEGFVIVDGYGGDSVYGGVRPALWLKRK